MEAVETVLLFDYYGRMLTDKQKEYLDLRYNQDLSLGEIAEIREDKHIVKLNTTCYNQDGKAVITGMATVKF